MSAAPHTIGIVGGMGPAAGVDLFEKVIRATGARSDHEHLPVVMISFPSMIPNRTPFLMSGEGSNPANAIYDIIQRLERAGATVVGIPCNTADAPAIVDLVRMRMKEEKSAVDLVSMIDVTVDHVATVAPSRARIGVLSTEAVRELGVYSVPLSAAGFEVVHPSPAVQSDLVSTAIFSRDYGLKAISPATARARENLIRAMEHLMAAGVEAVILGCTELPLAISDSDFRGIGLLDPTTLLARDLIRRTYPEMLVK